MQNDMKKWIYIAIAAAIVAVVALIWGQAARINKLQDERDKYRDNTETLLQEVEHYQTKDSLNVARVGELELKLSEFERYRAEDAKLIKTLKARNKELQAVTTAQLETITELRGAVKDSIVYLPGDTVKVHAKCIDIVEPYIELHGCATSDNKFVGTLITRESLLITEMVEYKRFLGFLWKTKKIKDREFDVVSKNLHTNIIGFEVVTIEK